MFWAPEIADSLHAPGAQNGGSACVLRGLLHHSAWCCLST